MGRPEVTTARKDGVGVVVDHDPVWPPKQDDRDGRSQKEAGDAFQALWLETALLTLAV